MRTHLVTLAATVAVIGFAMTAGAASMSGSSSGGSSSAGAAPSGGGSSGGSSSSSSSGGSSSSGSSHGGEGGGGFHGGGSAGAAASRGGGFEGRSGFNGYGSFGSQSRDIAHGGYQMVGIRPANVMPGSTTTVSSHIAHNSLALGPKLGSAAQAAALMDDKHRGNPGNHPHNPHHPHRINQAGLTDYVRFENCLPQDSCAYGLPQELCPEWPNLNGTVFADCSAPRKLKSSPKR
jgi:hypothetical protein